MHWFLPVWKQWRNVVRVWWCSPGNLSIRHSRSLRTLVVDTEYSPLGLWGPGPLTIFFRMLTQTCDTHIWSPLQTGQAMLVHSQWLCSLEQINGQVFLSPCWPEKTMEVFLLAASPLAASVAWKGLHWQVRVWPRDHHAGSAPACNMNLASLRRFEKQFSVFNRILWPGLLNPDSRVLSIASGAYDSYQAPDAVLQCNPQTVVPAQFESAFVLFFGKKTGLVFSLKCARFWNKWKELSRWNCIWCYFHFIWFQLCSCSHFDDRKVWTFVWIVPVSKQPGSHTRAGLCSFLRIFNIRMNF